MKVTIIGAGSYIWSFGFSRQLIDSKAIKGLELTLMDISVPDLNRTAEIIEKYNTSHGSPAVIRRSGDLNTAVKGADFVVVCISTGGLDAMEHDLAVPARYGIFHTVGDTVGPGGLLRAVRNIPVFANIGKAMQKYCPNAWLINVSNPLTVLTRTPHKLYGIKSIGMCPGVDEQAKLLCRIAGFANDARIDFTVAGIDHGSWFTSLMADGKDVLAILKKQGYCRSDGKLPKPVKGHDPLAEDSGSIAVFALWRELGYMPALNDRHQTENFPWFLAKDSPADIPYRIKRTSIQDRRNWRKGRIKLYSNAGSALEKLSAGHGDDPVVEVIESLAGFRSLTYSVNYRNIGQTPQLPADAVVETRARFDAAGVHPFASPLPPIPTITVLPHVLRQELIVDIALNGTFDDLVAMVLTDPLCSRLELPQCRRMVREMLQANRHLIPNRKLLKFN